MEMLDLTRGQWEPQSDLAWLMLQVHFAPVKGASEGPRMETGGWRHRWELDPAVLHGTVGWAYRQAWGPVGAGQPAVALLSGLRKVEHVHGSDQWEYWHWGGRNLLRSSWDSSGWVWN